MRAPVQLAALVRPSLPVRRERAARAAELYVHSLCFLYSFLSFAVNIFCGIHMQQVIWLTTTRIRCGEVNIVVTHG